MGQKNKDNQPEHTSPAQHLLTQYPQLAQQLRKSRNEAQIEVALAPIMNAPQDVQLAFLSALGKEKTTAAADLLLAINTYTSAKEVRKEARRSLIRLESANIYPEWELPTVMSLTEALGASAFGEEEEEEFDDDGDEVASAEIVEDFLEYWTEGEFAEAYDLLTSTSPLRGGLTRDAWVASRQAWAAEAKPNFAQVDVGYGLETTIETEDTSDAVLDETTEELDAFWSIEVKDIASGHAIPELPTATLVYQGTSRHWFWSSYTCVLEEDELRIHSMRDQGAETLQLTPAELQQRLQAVADEIHAMSVKVNGDEDEEDDENTSLIVDADGGDNEGEDDSEMTLEEVGWFTKQALHYCDALIAKQPDEDAAYQLGAEQAAAIEEVERSAAYTTLAAERFPETRAEALRSTGMACTKLAVEDENAYNDMREETDAKVDDTPFVSRFFPLAEKAYRDSLVSKNDVEGRLLLSDLFTTTNTKLDEAKVLFEEATALATDPLEKAAIAIGQAGLAMAQEKPAEALEHFQRASTIMPDFPNLWYNIAEIQLSLEQKEEAIQSLNKSMDVDPTTTDAYASLATLHMERDDNTAASKVLERGIAENPFAADLMTVLATIYMEEGNLTKAEDLIEEAEELEPEMELVQAVRQALDIQKTLLREQRRSSGSKSNKSKKKR